jgi:RNA polymerase sigma-70 factor (ECF subfamily)
VGGGSEPERDYLRRIAEGDRGGLELLEPIYRDRLLGYIRRWVTDEYLAEDILQDVWIAVWQGAHRYRGDGRVSAWLLGIAHNKVMSALRRRREMPDPAPDPGVSMRYGDPAEMLVAHENLAALRRQIRRLSAAQQATLDLVFVQGLSLSEVAEVMGCPVGTVKSRRLVAVLCQ